MRSRWLGAAALLGGVVLLAAGDGLAQPPGGGFPGGGGGFPGGPGGGGFGGRGGMPDPETIWNFMGGAGKDSIDINQNPFLKSQMERRGDPMPPNGILTKQQFLDGMQKRMAAARQGGGGMGGPPGAAPAPGGPPQGGWNGGGRNWGGGPPTGGGGWGGQGGGWGGPGGGWAGQGGPPQGPGQPGSDGQGGGKDEGKKDAEPDFTQIGIRYGKLPPGLPDWFTELDEDRDGQVALNEWRAAGRKTEDFTALDADGDWLLSPRELLRADAIKADERRLTSAGEGGDASTTRFPGAGSGRPGGGAGAMPGGKDGPAAKGGNRGPWGGGAGSGKKDRGKN